MIVDHSEKFETAPVESQSQTRPALSSPPSPQTSPDDLAQIITAYNQVTERLQQSHETLSQEVLRLRQELASTNAQLQRSKRLSALGEMAAGIAHEIRNPLAAIQLYAGMAIEDLPDEPDSPPQAKVHDHSPVEPSGQIPSDPAATLRAQINQDPQAVANRLLSARDSTEKIEAAVRRLSGIVNDVLSFARQQDPQPRTISVSHVFDRLIHAHRPAIDAAKVEVETHLDDNNRTLHADPDLLHQALLNLVRNAVDQMEPADESPETHVPAGKLTLAGESDESGSITLRVRDTGPGIDDEHVERIFNPFFTTRNTGTGLGLAIVHRIIDAHGGSICVSNDHGAVFEMTFPSEAENENAHAHASRLAGRRNGLGSILEHAGLAQHANEARPGDPAAHEPKAKSSVWETSASRPFGPLAPFRKEVAQ